MASDPDFRAKNTDAVKKWRDAHREQYNEYLRNRYHTDPEYRRKRIGYVSRRQKARAMEIKNMTDDEFLELCREYWGK